MRQPSRRQRSEQEWLALVRATEGALQALKMFIEQYKRGDPISPEDIALIEQTIPIAEANLANARK